MRFSSLLVDSVDLEFTKDTLVIWFWEARC
jgi:hypothetical protein